MLHISQAQLDVLTRNRMVGVEDAVVAHLRSDLTEIVAPRTDDMLRAFATQCLPRCEAYGLNSWRCVMAFVDTAFLLNDPNFDSNPAFPWAGRILRNERIDAKVKAEALLDWAFDVASGG